MSSYYLIKHKSSGEFMPQLKRDRGYSHWNPSNQKKMTAKSLGVPRLIGSEKKAKTIIRLWTQMPNAEYRRYTNHYGEEDYDIRINPDGRKREDLEIVLVLLVLEE